jgi:phage tail sheath gpL-like
MTGGQQDPDINDALAAVFASNYNIYCVPWAAAEQLTALREHLEAISGPLEQRRATGWTATPNSLATTTTLAGQLNGGRISPGCLPGTASLPEELAAAYAAVAASEEDPARPLNGLELKGIAAPAVADRLGRKEQEVMLKNGVTPLEVGPGEVVQIVRAVSSYTRNAVGATDISLLDMTTIRTMDYTCKAIKERVDLRFPREKLSARTPAKVRSEVLDVLRILEDLEILENVEANAEGVIVERDLQDPNRLNVKIPVDVVNGLHVLAARVDLLL